MSWEGVLTSRFVYYFQILTTSRRYYFQTLLLPAQLLPDLNDATTSRLVPSRNYFRRYYFQIYYFQILLLPDCNYFRPYYFQIELLPDGTTSRFDFVSEIFRQ